MSVLMRATEIAKRPVVTLAGEDIAQVKDIVYESDGGSVAGFTLAGRGMFAGPLKTGLVWAAVHGLGPDAVMVADEGALSPLDDVLGPAGERSAGGGDVLGSRVLTESGTDLGKVVDVVLEVGTVLDVVGYEIDPQEGKKVFIPLPDTLAVSGQTLVVPDAAREFVSDDLAGFGAAVTAFRAHFESQAGRHEDPTSKGLA
ncbi:MAG: PRC-barrel domain containing protein [Frankiales bacterium]|nr:PRC-barrel domain containing protein [Frankiales bacterium]